MEKKLLFIQPIVSHYRKSVIEEITKLEPLSYFWGTENFQGVEPLRGIQNVDNSFITRKINVLKTNFVWYKGMLSKFIKNKSTHVILSGVNPLLINTFIIFLFTKLFTNKKVYWWSQGKKFKQGFLGRKFRFLFYYFSDGVFLYSKQGKINFIEEGLPEHKLYVINNCLNFEDYGWLNYKLESKKNKEDFRILYTGRLSERKKVLLLLEAFNLLKKRSINNIFLDIVGNGEQFEVLKKYAVDNKIDPYVNFHGAKYGLDVHKHFLNADLVVCPGAVGLSIVHAFSFGLPFLTGEGDPAHSSELELLDINKNGDYFLLDDKASLAETILIWKDKITNNKEEYMENCIQSVIKNEYLPNLVAQKLVEAL